VRDAEIARRLGVNQSTVLRRLGRAHVQDPLPEPEVREPADTEPEAADQVDADDQADAEGTAQEPGGCPGPQARCRRARCRRRAAGSGPRGR
jgi:transposase-like protein